MSRFSPQVTPNSGAALAQALGQGVSSYLGARRQRQMDDRQQADDDLSLYHAGLRAETPEERLAVPDTATVNARMATALNPQAGLPTTIEANQPQEPVTIGGRRLVQTEQAQRSQVNSQQDRMLKALLQGSEIRKNDAQATKDLRTPQALAPLPGTPAWEHAKIREAQISNQYGYHAPVQNSYSAVTLGGAEGTPPTVKAFNTKTGQLGETLGQAKPAMTRIESATNTAAKARLSAAISEMNNAHGGMDDFERKLSSGEISINGLQQFMGRAANTFTHDDPVSLSLQSAALTTLNKTNPELARYVRRALSFAEGESMISQRPSDFRTKMAAFLSQAASGASPEMVHDIQTRRRSILDPLNAIGKGEQLPTQQTNSTPSLQERVQQLKAQGVSKDAAKALLVKEGLLPSGGDE